MLDGVEGEVNFKLSFRGRQTYSLLINYIATSWVSEFVSYNFLAEFKVGVGLRS